MVFAMQPMWFGYNSLKNAESANFSGEFSKCGWYVWPCIGCCVKDNDHLGQEMNENINCISSTTA